MRALWICLLVLGCSDRAPDAKVAPKASEAPKAEQSPEDQLKASMDGLKEVRDVALAEARREEDRNKQQVERLTQLSRDVEQLIAEGKLDQAELRAAEIRWQPDTGRSTISETDKKLIEQYDRQRETALRIIERKR